MTSAPFETSSLRGQFLSQAPLSPFTWFRVGGPAQWLFKPLDTEDLCTFLRLVPPYFPWVPLGVGSNVIIRDGGIQGVTLKLGKGFRQIHVDPPFIDIGAAVLDRTVAEVCRENGLGGLEFLVSIPGTMGGAVRMNAGAYGKEIADVLVFVDVCDSEGNLHRLTAEQCGFSYRHSSLPLDWTVVSLRCRGEKKDPKEIEDLMMNHLQRREATQPTRSRTGGSTFKNPPDEKAWVLIDQAGCRGLSRGDALVSPLHCNFLINSGHATATELEDLGEEIREKVLVSSGILLEWEVKRLGQR